MCTHVYAYDGLRNVPCVRQTPIGDSLVFFNFNNFVMILLRMIVEFDKICEISDNEVYYFVQVPQNLDN